MRGGERTDSECTSLGPTRRVFSGVRDFRVF